MPVILLEGCDGAGKTTLARALGGRYVHHGPADWSLRAYAQTLEAARRRGGLTVLDRGWPSELVYGPLLRGKSRLTLADARTLERLALAAGTTLVVCDPGWRLTREAWETRGDLLVGSRETLRAIYLAYRHLGSALLRVRFDRRVAASPAIPEVAVAPPHVTGRWAPGETVLLVGEAPTELGLPFVSDRGCVPWLSARLAEAGVRERSLTWVNARDRRGRETRLSLVSALAPRHVVLLGRVAARWWVDRGDDREVHHAPHPQFWKRFHHRRDYPLLDLLTRLTR